MTSPLLAQDSPYGRLYRHPKNEGIEMPVIEEAVASGLLVPSVTNVIGSLDKPFLTGWHGRLAAQAAVDTVFNHPGLIQRKPHEAKEFIKNAAPRKLEEAGILGNSVHNIVEALAQGQDAEIEAHVQPYIDSFHDFIEQFSPTYHHFEVTCFGSVFDPNLGELKYAGTADFVASINGLMVIGDYKSGKSIHTEASLQLAALANATEMVTSEGALIPMPKIDSGAILHLSPKGFALYQSEPFGVAWEVFSGLRKVWDFHVANLASRQPILMSRPIKKAEAFVLPARLHPSSLKSAILNPLQDNK